jgi:hypothetical protein
LLFDGTLGDGKTKPVSFQVRGRKQHTMASFPSAKKSQDTLIKEVERLYLLRALKQQQASKRVSPLFIVPNKNKTVCSFSNFQEVPKGQLGNPCQFPKISMVLHELKEFSYETALDLNLDYYTIRLDEDTSKICTIILYWGLISHKI